MASRFSNLTLQNWGQYLKAILGFENVAFIGDPKNLDGVLHAPAFKEAVQKVRASVRPEDMKHYEEIENTYIRTARGAAITSKTNYFG